MKLLAFITADVQPEVNAWIFSNFPEAGDSTFSAPYSATGTRATPHYATCWRITDSMRQTITDHLDTAYPSKAA